MTEQDVENLLRATAPLEGPGLPLLAREFRPGSKPTSPRPLLREPQLHRRIAIAAASLVFALTAWALFARRPDPAGQAESALPGRGPAAQDPGPSAEELLKKDPELKARLLQVAQEEKDRLSRFEKRLGEIEKGLLETETDLREKRVKEASDRSDNLLHSFPGIELAVLDPSAIEYRARVLQLRLGKLWNSAQLALLKDAAVPEVNRMEAENLFVNRIRQLTLELKDVEARGPQARHSVVQPIGGAVSTLADATKDKLRSVRMTIDLQESSFSECIDYYREISGLNFVLRGTPEQRSRKVTVRLTDAVFEGVLQECATLANYRWEVNSFGMVVLSPGAP